MSVVQMHPHRIYILGGPGSGKSTLARQLGKLLDLTVYDLDLVAFEGPNFERRPLELQLADVRRIAEQPSWIAEGMFLGWTEDLLRAADLVIWLDGVRWHLAAWRIVVRAVRWALEEMKRQPGRRKFTRWGDYSRNLRLLAGALFSSRKYYNPIESATGDNDIVESRTATAKCLKPYWNKVVHCRSKSDIQSLVSNIKSGQPVSTMSS